jgi:uncharacterized membrane protein
MTPVPARKHAATEDVISRVLRVGVTASLILISAGTLLSFLQGGGYGGEHAEVARLTGARGAFPRNAAWLFGGLLHADGQAVIVLGLILLIATPVVRVAVSAAAFARQRDRAYVAITLVVLALLGVSLVLGKVG